MTAARSWRERLAVLAGLRAWRVGIHALPAHVCFFALTYLVVMTGGTPGVLKTLLLMLALEFYFAYGVLINDLSDRELDAAASKSGSARGHGLNAREEVVVLGLLLVAELILISQLGGGLLFNLLWVASFVAATLYSVPPVRLKTRGVWGFLADSLMEKPLPVLIVFAFFGYFGFEAVLFPVLGELLDSVFKHQAEDYDIDAAQGVRTLAVGLGKEKSITAVDGLLHPLNALAVVLLFAVPLFTLPAARPFMAAASALLIAGFAVFAELRRRGRVRRGFPFKDPPMIGYLNLGFRCLALPALLVAAVLLVPAYWPVALIMAVSVGIYAKGVLGLGADLLRYVSGRGSPAAHP